MLRNPSSGSNDSSSPRLSTTERSASSVFGTDAALLFERETEWAAPNILMSELHNVLVGFVRRGAVTSEQAKAMSNDAAVVLGDRIASVSGRQVIDVALECGLTAYDAEFVALARALDVSLATLDKAVLHGAADVAVSLRTYRTTSLRRVTGFHHLPMLRQAIQAKLGIKQLAMTG